MISTEGTQNNIEQIQHRIKKPTRKMEERSTRVISLTSGKGGVGKTLLTINLGLSLVKSGNKVLLLDADLGLANIHVMLGFETKNTLHDVFQGRASLADVIVSLPCGLDVLPASSGIHSMTKLTDGEQLQLISAAETLKSHYDYVLIDTAAGIGDNVLYFNTVAHDVLVVIDEEPTSLTDAYALIKVLATQCGVNNFYVVANRTPSGVDGKNVFSQLMKATDRFLTVRLTYLGSVSDDSSVSQAIVSQKPFLQLFPGSRTSWDITSVARRISDLPPTKKANGGLQLFFKDLIERN